MKVWDFIKSKLKKDKQVILMVVIDSHGSSPGRRGFKMAVADDGEMIGSIGGGVMEYNLVELAKKQFEEQSGIFCKYQEHSSKGDEESSGMICSGSQLIAFYPLDRSYLPLVESIAGTTHGKLVFTEAGFLFNREVDLPGEFVVDIKDGNKWSFTEQLGHANHIYIFGAGHVSVSVSRIFRQLGFNVTVFDNRNRQLTTFKGNSFAHSKKIIDYKKAAKYVPEGDNIYVVIMTFAHKDDRRVLKRLLDKKVKYLGMMGSEEKVASIFSKLKTKGVSQKQLEWVDSPIGLPIGSQTPDEIAISIAAKIISVKNS
jgi:xanthine dehydrogenase accessory factor